MNYVKAWIHGRKQMPVLLVGENQTWQAVLLANGQYVTNATPFAGYLELREVLANPASQKPVYLKPDELEKTREQFVQTECGLILLTHITIAGRRIHVSTNVDERGWYSFALEHYVSNELSKDPFVCTGAAYSDIVSQLHRMAANGAQELFEHGCVREYRWEMLKSPGCESFGFPVPTMPVVDNGVVDIQP